MTGITAKLFVFSTKWGGIVRTKPVRQLVVGPAQIQVLRAAGLVPKLNGKKINLEAAASKQLN
jgi:hypothetical protein